MSQNLSKIKNLYHSTDGDNISARMGYRFDGTGHGLTQYWNVAQKKVVATDFKLHPPTFYPLPYSSKGGRNVVPETTGMQWYYNNPETDSAGILDSNGNVKAAYQSLFQKTTIVVGSDTYPALKVIDNLAKENDLTDKYIYFKGTYNGKPFMAEVKIPVLVSAETGTEILISKETQDGSGSNVLSNDNTWVKLTAALQRSGATITTGVTYQWQKLVDGTWTNVSNQLGVIEVISADCIKVYGAGVDSEDLFRVAATYQGETKYKTEQLTDEADPFYIFDGCNIIGDAVEEGQNASFSPVVYNRATAAPDTTNTWNFRFMVLNMITGMTVTPWSTTIPFVVPFATISEQKGVQVVINARSEG